MFKPLLLSLCLSSNVIDYPEQTYFVFDGDYTDVAQEYLDKNKPVVTFDPNDILYKAIIKEIEESGLEP